MLFKFYVNSMPTQVALTNRYLQRCVMETLNESGITIKHHTLNEFMKDKAFRETEELAVVTGRDPKPV